MVAELQKYSVRSHGETLRLLLSVDELCHLLLVAVRGGQVALHVRVFTVSVLGHAVPPDQYTKSILPILRHHGLYAKFKLLELSRQVNCSLSV